MGKKYLADENDLVSVADSIRAKTGLTDKLVWPSGYKAAISTLTNSSATYENSASEFLHNIHVDEYHDDTTDTQYQVIRVYKNKLDGSKQFPFVIAPNGSGACTESTYTMNNRYGFKLAINSGIFDMSTGKPDGIVIQNGKIIQDKPTVTYSGCRPLTIDTDGDLSYEESDVSAAQMVMDGVVSSVCAFMPIIVDYEKFPQSKWNAVNHYNGSAQRQIIGQYGNGDYCIITSEGRGFDSSVGWTIAQAQDICVHLGLKFAYNLDGGGSTETMILHRQSNMVYEGDTGRSVPVFIVFTGDTSCPMEVGDTTYSLSAIEVEVSSESAETGTNTASLIKSVTATYTGSDGSTHTGGLHRGYTVTPETIAKGNNSITVSVGNVSANATITGTEPVPITYTYKTYLSFDGGAWIDTGLVPTSKTSAEYKYEITKAPTAKTAPHILSSDTDFFPTVRYAGDCFAHRGDSEYISDDKKYGHFSLSTPYTVSAWRSENSATVTTGSSTLTFTGCTYGSTASTTNLLLGRYYADAKYNFTGNVYYLKIYENSSLVRDFVPAIRDTDGVAGMYDKANSKFYTSEGTAFTAS